MPAFMARTSRPYLSPELGVRRPKRDGAADLRELSAVARRDLGHQDVAVLHHAPVRRRHRRIARPGAEQQEIVLGAERLGVPPELGRKLVLAHAGTRDLEQSRIAELGDARRLARMRDLFHGLGCGGIEHDIVGGARLRQHLRQAAGDVPTRRTRARRSRSCRCASDAGCESAASASTTSSAATTAQLRAAVGRALGIPCRRHDQARFAVARQDDGRGSQRLEAAQHQHRIGGLDEMRAVVYGDDEVEPVLDHAGADGGKAFVEGHGVFPGLIRRLRGSIAVQIPSGPPASPRSVSANSSSSGSVLLIMPCWWV